MQVNCLHPVGVNPFYTPVPLVKRFSVVLPFKLIVEGRVQLGKFIFTDVLLQKKQ